MDWKNWMTIFLTVFVFWLAKRYIPVPPADMTVISMILTVTSILFGFLASFFIAELWSRYSELRLSMTKWGSNMINVINYAKRLFKNSKKFEKEFREKLEAYAISDSIVHWWEVHKTDKYFNAIYEAFDLANPKTDSENTFFEEALINLDRASDAKDHSDILGKDRLFSPEWIIMILLSGLIIASLFFIESEGFLLGLITVFPGILVLALIIIYNLDRLKMREDLLGFEICQRMFDALGVKRFYLKRNLKRAKPKDKNYRTEDDLTGYLKKVYLDVEDPKRIKVRE
jgi:uncharacterized membrane protein (DUF441 family)